MTKKELRKLYKSKRAELTVQQRLKFDDLMLIQFQKLSLPFLHHVLSFYPLEEKGEMDTFIFTDYLQFTNPGLVVAYPKTNLQECSMQAIATTNETDFEDNEWGIPEPATGETIEPHLIDAVLVPMLAFDEKGHRAGYGKGFYDRFLHGLDLPAQERAKAPEQRNGKKIGGTDGPMNPSRVDHHEDDADDRGEEHVD